MASAAAFVSYLAEPSPAPLLLAGEAELLLSGLPAESVDCILTSPPYWAKREYSAGGIGLETDPADYVRSLLRICAQLHRILKPSGSFWLNLGDSYLHKNLLGLPWRVAHAMIDEQGWILRNDIIWHKVKGGPDNANDKLRNVHEHLFHFVKTAKGYYYDTKAVRMAPRAAKIVRGAVVSATGVSGVRYQRQIELSPSISAKEKVAAREALKKILAEVADGRLADFRMIIRKQQRTTHSASNRVSGRARELEQRGFYFLKYHPDGSKLSDVWDILPEDTQLKGRGANNHFAPYPTDLCRIPILATCPPGGLVLDPFVGTGTTCLVAAQLGRKSVGIDISPEYLDAAQQRLSREASLSQRA